MTRICLAQLDCRVGDVEANKARAREVVAEAAAAGADLVVFPELFLSGYALRGVEHETACEAAGLVPLAGGVSVLLGFHERDGELTYNSAAWIERGGLLRLQRKLYLVEYEPFAEHELYEAGDELHAFETRFGPVAVLICNDAWQPVLPFVASQEGARVLFVPAASSTSVPEAEAHWRDLTRVTALTHGCWVVFANRAGSDAQFTYWGGSHVVDPLGEVVAEAPRLEEALLYADVDLALAEAEETEPRVAEPRLDMLLAELEQLEGSQ